jgi:hypothetical protein
MIEENVKKSEKFIKDGKLNELTSNLKVNINNTLREKTNFDMEKFITTVKSELEKDLKKNTIDKK